MTLGNPHLPWTSGHVRQKLDAAYEKRVPSFVVQGTSSRTVPETTDEESVATIQASIVSAASYEVARRDDWIVEHIAAPGCWTEVVGEVKKGKTTFNAQMIRSVLEGKPFLTWKVRQTGVVLYTEQVGLSLDATLERAGVRRHPNLYVLDQSKTFGKPWTHVACALIRRCEEVGAQLLFVDTLTRLAGVGGEGENFSGVVSILDPFREAKARGVACVFVRHAGKSRENREDASRAGRGSTALTGDMDIAVNLFQPGSEDVRRVKTISRLGEEITVLLRYDGSGYEAVEGGEVPVSGRERKATEMRDKVDTEFRSGNTTAAGVAKALGVDRKTAAKYIAELTGGFVVAGEGSDG
ncbi:MAG: AAA family ATPase [Egibacteraceae bacterium]